MPDTVIVIPTYWTWPATQAGHPIGVVYDHPTPLDGESTLPRLLESLTALRGPEFSVLILTAVTHPELEQAAADRITDLCTPFRSHFPLIQATEADATFIRQHLPSLIGEGRDGVSPGLAHVQMRSYAGVRNLQLLLPHALGAEVIVALDDDEIVAPDYLRVATELVGQERDGERILGLAGFYRDAGGSVLSPEHPRTGNLFQDKSCIMNEGARALQAAPGRLARTPVAFGGNMVFHRDLFSRVGFDPSITRGEDIDYVINAQLQGYDFWFDRELVITHLPPAGHQTSPYAKLVQDVYRFVYEREKLRLAGWDPAQFDPYPGRFLRDDLETQAQAALQAAATPEDTLRYGSPEAILAQARRHAREVAPRYAEFRDRWPRLMAAVGQDAALRERLLARCGQ